MGRLRRGRPDDPSSSAGDVEPETDANASSHRVADEHRPTNSSLTNSLEKRPGRPLAKLGPRGKEGCGVAGTMRWPAFATRDDSKANPAQPGLHLFGGCTVQWFDRHQRHAERHQFHRDPFNPRQHPQLIHRRADTPRAGQSPHPVRCPACRGLLTSTHPIGHIPTLGRHSLGGVPIGSRSRQDHPRPRPHLEAQQRACRKFPARSGSSMVERTGEIRSAETRICPEAGTMGGHCPASVAGCRPLRCILPAALGPGSRPRTWQ